MNYTNGLKQLYYIDVSQESFEDKYQLFCFLLATFPNENPHFNTGNESLKSFIDDVNLFRIGGINEIYNYSSEWGMLCSPRFEQALLVRTRAEQMAGMKPIGFHNISEFMFYFDTYFGDDNDPAS